LVTDYWTAASGNWSAGGNWSSLAPPPAVDTPSGIDTNLSLGFFTNAATYTVNIDPSLIQVATNSFANSSNTSATVTLNIPSGNEFDPSVRLTVADKGDSTTNAYAASHACEAPAPGALIDG